MGPNEVHVYDPAFYHELYRLGSKYYKDPSMHKVLGAPTSTLAESDPVRHRQRRAPLESLFAKKNILKLEPMLMENIEYCSTRFDEFFARNEPVSMEWALKSLAMGLLTRCKRHKLFHYANIACRYGVAVCIWPIIERAGRSAVQVNACSRLPAISP
jgi:hypothetical protein